MLQSPLYGVYGWHFWPFQHVHLTYSRRSGAGISHVNDYTMLVYCRSDCGYLTMLNLPASLHPSSHSTWSNALHDSSNPQMAHIIKDSRSKLCPKADETKDHICQSSAFCVPMTLKGISVYDNRLHKEAATNKKGKRILHNHLQSRLLAVMVLMHTPYSALKCIYWSRDNFAVHGFLNPYQTPSPTKYTKGQHILNCT